MSTKYFLAATVAAAIIAAAAPGVAHAVPEQLGFAARVSNNGTPLTGSHVFITRLYDAPSGGSQAWTETNTATATDGLVYLTLGTQTALDAGVLDGGPLWLEVQVDGTPLMPRLPVTSAAYAVRAGLAEDAERLGGQPSTSFAAAGHNHNGAYLPVGATLACAGTQKVTALNANGSVTCGADVDTSTTYTAGAGLSLAGTTFAAAFGGSGAATTVARSDHAHTGVYLPVGTTLTCPAGQKVSALNPSGSVTCAADLDTDTNTTYSAGNGLALTGTTFSTNFSGTGTAPTSARSDHTHAKLCPTGYDSHAATGAAPLCIKRVVEAVTWNDAATRCFVNHNGGQLCTYSEVRIAATTTPTVFLQNGHWLADRTGDNLALKVNGTNNADFDEESDVMLEQGNGYYCCQRGN
jgi:hypothetical protein